MLEAAINVRLVDGQRSALDAYVAMSERFGDTRRHAIDNSLARKAKS
jgi:hypothetical protein